MDLQILTSRKLYPNTLALILPFIIWKKSFLKKNYNIRILFDHKHLNYTEVIILDSKYHRDLWSYNSNKVKNEINLITKKCNKLIYFDTTDSTSSIQIELLDVVYKYWKMQIFKDKLNYKKKFYGGRIFTDYLLKKGIKDNKESSLNNIIEKDIYLNKIECAWNSSFNRYDYFGNYFTKILVKSGFNNFIKFNKNYFTHNNTREFDLFSKFNENYSRKTISYQRKLIKDILSLHQTKSISKLKYLRELKSSKFCIAPYGWGEISYRDFECITYGSILIKPNMEHLDTWPNYYQNWHTYIPIKWDCSDLKTTLSNCILDYNKLINLSFNAQKIYKEYTISENAANLFIKRFENLLGITRE